MDPKELLSIDPLLADRIRLAIMATLNVAEEPVDFASLLDDLDLTKGNLSTHMRKLEDGDLITIAKEFVGRKPRTTYSCTKKGRVEFKRYLDTIGVMISTLEG
jgi:DNA-binding transcriptional ArsR family regulator